MIKRVNGFHLKRYISTPQSATAVSSVESDVDQVNLQSAFDDSNMPSTCEMSKTSLTAISWQSEFELDSFGDPNISPQHLQQSIPSFITDDEGLTFPSIPNLPTITSTPDKQGGYFPEFLGSLPAALYCFYFHQKCPERPEQCQYIYIYVCQQHGGREVGTKSFGYISVKFILLLLILSAKGLLDQKSSSKYYFSQ